MEPVTVHPDADEQLLYFTSSSLLAGDRGLVFISERTGQPNVFVRTYADGAERQLTRNDSGVLQSYVYFDGDRHRGLGKASICLDPQRGRIYFIQGRDVYTASVEGDYRKLAGLPDDQVTAFTHVSGDGRLLCVPTTDAEAWDDALLAAGNLTQTIDARVQHRGLSSYLRIFDTRTGEQLVAERIQRAWVTHVQFHPTDPRRILYNHEWPSDCGVRRMWLWDGESYTALRAAEDGGSAADWVCHEMWSPAGNAVIYHGRYADSERSFIGRIDMASGRMDEIPLPRGWNGYGHFTLSPDGRLVTDGYYQATPEDDQPHGTWISTLAVDWTGRRIEWQPRVRHGSSWASQDVHPHPVFDHAGRHIYFTSDPNARRTVYRVTANGAFGGGVSPSVWPAARRAGCGETL